jgi:hypothetical protein
MAIFRDHYSELKVELVLFRLRILFVLVSQFCKATTGTTHTPASKPPAQKKKHS